MKGNGTISHAKQEQNTPNQMMNMGSADNDIVESKLMPVWALTALILTGLTLTGLTLDGSASGCLPATII